MAHNIIEEICSLQPLWSSDNTPHMKRRGELIRGEFTEFIKSLKPEISEAMGQEYTDISFEGKDGVGRKTDVPWSRFYSKSRSKSATQGWYVVYLFPTSGNGVYVCLAHGSSRLENGSFVPRSNAELKQLTDWGSAVIADSIASRSDIVTTINLESKLKLAQSYEKSVIAAKYYDLANLPSLDDLTRDACLFAGLLSQLYFGEDMGRAPDQEDRVVSDVKSASHGKCVGQGFKLTGPERKAIELRAMQVAQEHLITLGYDVEDVSGNESYDFKASKEGCSIPVEVKGTTSSIGTIVLTRNEVELHMGSYPNNMLIVVSDINLYRSTTTPIASGGNLTQYFPWKIDDSQLKVISYEYNLI
ncbi:MULTISPECIES: MrcB family domain-containing protein [unclassified Vibrio]|uniref:MrcB family domain-containing protein n=1 Tax=unclassified Vibrio TaxID=2614977 RepID=UPI001A90C247|nr:MULTISPECIES: DUF3578 domain-containing protein [unclassified Vibrio]MBO0135333.1 DUF3578 domain-containing protein [Vibrio sp. Vb2736]MDW1855487.1 DUF3578 domain-containing protein [Vibrio sp. Vb0974]MDW2049431.1 DUF3578 domain-containing protein [Vibrio sp. 977]